MSLMSLGVAMNQETQILLGGLMLVWLASMVLVARKSHLKTYLRYLDALAFLPLLLVLIPPSVWLVDRLSPFMLDLLDLVPEAQVQSVMEPYRWTLSNLLALGLVAVGPGLIMFGWRRLLTARDQTILARRASHSS